MTLFIYSILYVSVCLSTLSGIWTFLNFIYLLSVLSVKADLQFDLRFLKFGCISLIFIFHAYSCISVPDGLRAPDFDTNLCDIGLIFLPVQFFDKNRGLTLFCANEPVGRVFLLVTLTENFYQLGYHFPKNSCKK